MAQYAKVIVEATVFRDPETAKAYLKKNPDLLRQYIDEVDGPFLEAYSRKLGKTKETLIEERVNQHDNK
jgi:hypothetical protein